VTKPFSFKRESHSLICGDVALIMSRRVDSIPSKMKKWLVSIEKETGWKGVFITAGPMPKDGGRVTVMVYAVSARCSFILLTDLFTRRSTGFTVDEESETFEDAHETSLQNIAETFRGFVDRCFRECECF
jgi:hypothetical protein